MTIRTDRQDLPLPGRVKTRLLLLVAPALIIAGCATATLLTPSQSDVNRVQEKFPGYTLDDLHRGKALFENNCQSCHALKNPASKTEAAWNRIVPVMVAKVNRDATVLDKGAEEDIRRYVITMGSAPAGSN
jgi:hypothetical protein